MIRACDSVIKTVYPAGRFHGWQDEFVRDVFPTWDVLDPRNNRQGAIAKLVEDDMGGVKKADAIFCRLPAGKSLPVMGYAEIGSARVMGKPIILVDENETRELIIHNLASEVFKNYKDGLGYLMRGNFELTNKDISERDAVNPVNKIAFAGDITIPRKLNKEIVYPNILKLEDLAEADLLAVSFESEKRDPKALAIMGAAYTLGIPIALYDANPIIYPPLAGLARRIFTGDKGRKAIVEYLKAIQSNDINSEAVVMYNLFKKFNN
jgi:hypothetical protein